MNLPELPHVDPNKPVVEIYTMSCRSCEAHGPWVNTADADDPGHLWDVDHSQTAGHANYYRWSVTRQTARIY